MLLLEMGVSLWNSVWPGTHSVYEAALKFIDSNCSCPSSARIKGVHHHAGIYSCFDHLFCKVKSRVASLASSALTNKLLCMYLLMLII